MARFNLAPSRLARYYFFECDRFLRYDATPMERRAEEGIPRREFDASPVTQAILAGGQAWEEHVLTTYLPDAVTGAPGADTPADVTGRTLDYHATVQALRDAKPGTAIYQPTLRAPRSMYDAYGLDPDLVSFGDSRPDLLMVVDSDDGPEIRVVDLKASDFMKLSDRVQVGIYTLLLQHMLRAEGLDRLRPSRVGGVWLYQVPEPEWFPLSSIIPPIEAFLERELTDLLTTPAGEVFWHLYYRCEWCDFYQHCRGEAERTDDVSLVPYLSSFGKRHLRASADVTTVAGFADALGRDDADDLLRGSASLEGRATHFRRAITALRSGEPQPTGAASVAMPRWEDVRVVLTLQEDPLSGEVFGYAINRALGKKVFGNGAATWAEVAADGSPETLRRLRRSLVRDLMEILRAVDDYNANRTWQDQQSLQAYVFDTYERELLVGTLLKVIEEARDLELIEDALAVLFHFQHPDLAQADDQPEKEVLFPLVVLTEVLRAVYALPIPVVYRFADVNQVLQPEQFGFAYRSNDWFDFRLSNRMRADAILRAWTRDDAAVLDDIRRRLQLRVWGANSVINGLRERLRGTDALFAWPPKFRLPASFGFTDPLLSRLAFIAQYERMLGYLDVRGRRTRPLAEGLSSGDTYELVAEEGGWFRLHPRHVHPDLAASGFASHVLTTGTEAGRQARLTYDEFRGPWPSKRHAVAIAKVLEVRELPDGTHVRLDLKFSQAFTAPSPGDVCYLDGLFADWSAKRVVDALRLMDDRTDPWFSRLLRDPVGTRRPTMTPAVLRQTAIELADGHGMTASQRVAFRGVVDRDVQLVWGPPGTGKTHFVALAILALAEAYRRAGRRLRVLITAQTHTAIDKRLAKQCELQSDRDVFGATLPVRKLTTPGGGVESLGHSDAPGWAAQHPICVLGSTVWQINKVSPDDLAFDLMVVDEGSQVKVGEAAIPLLRRAERGRVVIAGDDKQLPPIVVGAYPEVADEPLLHRSVLEAIRHRNPDDVLTAPLLENWRMCDVLCAYPAASIYPAGYASATPQIAARRLPASRGAESELSAAVLDPDFPLVVCVLDDVQATAENRVEAGLVADVTMALRSRFAEADDEHFWRDHLFVISPHHVQTRAVRRALDRERQWDARPFVDTVDRMQGQERDAVIVSYGVSDVEYAGGHVLEPLPLEAQGGDAGRGGGQEPVAVQLPGVAGDAEGEGLARPGPADDHRDPVAALAQVTHHGLLIDSCGRVGGQGLAHRLVGGHGRLLVCSAGGGGDQLLFDGQELGGGPAAFLQGPVGDHADRPLGQEPVGQLLELGPFGAGQAGADGDQDLGAGEGGRVLGQPVRAGQAVEQLTGRRFGHRLVLDAVGCPAGHLPDEGVRVVSALGRLLTPSVIQGVCCLVFLRLAGGLDRPLDQPGRPLPPVRDQPVQLGVDLVGALGEAAHQRLGHAGQLAVAVAVRWRPLHPQCPDELTLADGPVDGVGGQPMPVQVPAVQGRPPSVRPLDAVSDDQMGMQQRVTLPRGPVVESNRQHPLSGHVLDTTVAATGAQVSVQVGDRLGQPSMVGGQHRSSGGRVAQAVEDRDALGRPQDHVKGRHAVAAMEAAQQLATRGVAALEHPPEPRRRCFALQP